MQVLTSSDAPGSWSPDYSIESILLTVVMNMISCQPEAISTHHGQGRISGPLRIDLNQRWHRGVPPIMPYSGAEAQAAYSRMLMNHRHDWGVGGSQRVNGAATSTAAPAGAAAAGPSAGSGGTFAAHAAAAACDGGGVGGVSSAVAAGVSDGTPAAAGHGLGVRGEEDGAGNEALAAGGGAAAAAAGSDGGAKTAPGALSDPDAEQQQNGPDIADAIEDQQDQGREKQEHKEGHVTAGEAERAQGLKEQTVLAAAASGDTMGHDADEMTKVG